MPPWYHPRDLSEESKTRRQGAPPLLRIFLVVLFGGSGVWLLLNSLSRMIDLPRDYLWGTAWTWSSWADQVFYRTTAGVWVGLELNRVFGSNGRLFFDFVYSLVYLAAAVMVFHKVRIGNVFTQTILIVSTVMFGHEDLMMEVYALRETGRLKFSVTVASFVGYAVLSYVISRTIKRIGAGLPPSAHFQKDETEHF